MQKLLGLIGFIIALLFGLSYLKDKSDEKKKFEEQEAFIQKTNDCLTNGDWVCAEKNIRVLLKETPQDTNLKLHLAGILLEQGKYTECLEHIRLLTFESATAKTIQEKAEQLLRETSELSVEDSRHFRLEFDSSPAKTDIYEALTVLEVAYDSLSRLFDFYPEERIHLVLYQSKEFQGSSVRPEWVLAVFDGKLRISLNAMKHQELYRPMIIHELTHAFIHAMTKGNIPLWLNEGIAQVIDGSSLSERPLGKAPTITELTNSFIKEKNRDKAVKLYWYSLAMVKKMLSQNISLKDMKSIIENTGNYGIEKALAPYNTSAELLLKEVSP